jgi:molybdopterin converting factor small subunit
MRISAKYLGHLRDELGNEDSYDFPSDSKPHLLSEILKEFSKSKGNVFLKTIYSSDGTFKPHITVILDGKVILDDKVEINRDCEILFIPFLSGG